MKSEGMGITEISLGRLQEIAKNEGIFTTLQNVGPTFYSDLNKELARLRLQREDFIRKGQFDEADMTAERIRRIKNTTKDILIIRQSKLVERALYVTFNEGAKPELTQATPEERTFFSKATKAIAILKAKGGL